MAYVVSQYAFRSGQFEKYGAEPSPVQVRELLDEVQRSARSLSSALGRLQELAARLSDESAPLAGPHLAGMDAVIAQAIAGHLAPDVSEEHLLIGHLARSEFMRRLANVDAAAEVARKHLDPNLLKRARTSENRSLRTLVGMAKPIWQSLTGRKPSVNKVGGERRSDFATFVQELANIAGGPAPTFKQVQTAFKGRTPN